MNAIVDTINSAGRVFVDFALPMLIQSSVLIVILLVVDVLLRKRVRAVFRYWVWMLVLIKLVLPPSLWSPVSVGTWFGDTLDVTVSSLPEADEPPAAEPPSTAVRILSQPVPPPMGPIAAIPEPRAMTEKPLASPSPAGVEGALEPKGAGAPVEASRSGPAAAASSAALDWRGFILLTWASVAAALLLLLLQRAVFVRGLVAQAEEANAFLHGALDECRARLGFRGDVALKVSSNATSPAVCGLSRPVILIPKILTPKLKSRDLQAVLLHELAHIKRGDLWINLAQTCLQIVYFYNPVLWLASAVIRRAREQAVDETVLVAMGRSASDYPETLVHIARLAFKRRPALSLRLIGVVESKAALTARIKHILNRPIPRTARLGILSLAAIIILAAVLLPMGKAETRDAVGSRLAVLPNCGVWTSDIDGHDLPVLDLAGEKVIKLQAVENEHDLLERTKAGGLGDILYYYDRAKQLAKITFLRGAGLHGEPVSDEYETLTVIPMEIPFETTVTTPGNQRFAIRIIRTDEHGCVIQFRSLEAEVSAPKAVLANGITVELLGVCEHPSAGKQWWRPDGSKMKEAPRNQSNANVHPHTSESAYEFAVRLHDLPKGAAVTLKTEPTGTRTQGPGLEGLRWLATTLPNDLPQCQLLCGIAAGAWDTLAQSAGAAQHVSGTALGGVMFSEASERADGALSITTADDIIERPCRVVALANDGRTIEASEYQWGEAGKARQTTSRFDGVSLSEIAEFQFQTRPWTWIEFGNVSLRPGRETNVEVRLPPDQELREQDKAQLDESAALPLTRRTERVMPLAEQEARRLNHGYVGTEHMLVALARDSEAVSTRVLASLGVDLDTLRAEMARLVKPGSEPSPSGKLPRMPLVDSTFNYARQEATKLGHEYLGTEHLLLGIQREREGLGARMLDNLGLTSESVKAEILKLVRPAPGAGAEVTGPVGEEASSASPGPELASPPIFGHDVKLNFADPTVRDGSFHSEQSVAFIMSFHGIGDLKPGVLLSGVLLGQTNRSFILEDERITIQDGSTGREIGSETWPVSERQFDRVVTLPVTYGQKEYSCPVHVEMDRHEDGSLTGSYWYCAYLSGRLPWGAGGRSFEIVNVDQQMEFRLVGDGTNREDAVLGIDIDGNGKIDPSKAGGERLSLYEPFQVGSTTYRVAEVDPYLPRVVFRQVGPAPTLASGPQVAEPVRATLAGRIERPDKDGDGLSDFQERHKYLTDPTKKDSDGDGTPDGDWDERREYTYSVRTVLRYMPPFDEDALSDDFQDARVLRQTDEFIELEVVHYPLAAPYESLGENPNWRRDYARLTEYLAPGATANWDEPMRRALLAELRADGIDVTALSDRQVVEQVSRWLLKNSRHLDKVFTTFYVHCPNGRPEVLPGLEDAFKREFERDQENYDWTIEDHLDHEVLGKGMFYNKTYGSCTSTAVYLTTVLRALGIPTRMVLVSPAVDASDREQILMARRGLTHHRVRETVLAGLRRSSHGFTNHTLNEVYVGRRWVRLDSSTLGPSIFGVHHFGLQTHLYTINDLGDIDLASTWGRRYAKGQRSDFFKHSNPYSAVEMDDRFGVHSNVPNPPFTARDLATGLKPDIFVFSPANVSVWDELLEIVRSATYNKTGRPHQREYYDNVFEGVWQTKPGDILVLLFALDAEERVPAGYEDLLPQPWPQIESRLQQNQTVELAGQARDMKIILLATPRATQLKPLVRNSPLLAALGASGKANKPVVARERLASAPPGCSVKFADGVEVRLLGVCTHPSAGQTWWGPDGAPLEAAPYETTSSRLEHEQERVYYEFAAQMFGSDDLSVRWKVPGGTRGSDTGRAIGPGGKRLARTYAYTANQPLDAKTANVFMGIASGPWETRAVHEALDNEGSYTLKDNHAVAFGVAYEKDGQAHVPITTNIKSVAMETRLVAIDAAGRLHTGGSSGSGGNVLHSSTCEFDVALDRIREFRFETRPYMWVEFRNVSLRRGQPTDVQVRFAATYDPDAADEVVLPDVDHEAVMLDLASGQLVSVPDVQPPAKLLEAIRESGKGDIVLDSRSLILVRGATSRQAEDGPVDLVKVVKIGSNLPETVTVTTAEDRQYEITVLSVDDRACTLTCSRVPTDRGAGGGAPDAVAGPGLAGQNWTLTLGWNGEQVALPGSLDYPQWIENTPEYERWKQTRGMQTFRKRAADGSVLQAACAGSTPDADGNFMALILSVRRYRPDGSLQNETSFAGGPDQQAKGWSVHETDGSSFRVDKRRESRVTWYDRDGKQVKQWRVSPYDVVFSELYGEQDFAHSIHELRNAPYDPARQYRDQRFYTAPPEGHLESRYLTVAPSGREPSRGIDAGLVPEARKTGGALAFRIAVSREEVSEAAVDECVRAFLAGLPRSSGNYGWFEVRPNVTLSPELVTWEHEGKVYLLLRTGAPDAMRPGDGWAVERVEATTDAMSRPAVQVSFGPDGAERLHALTQANVKKTLAILVEGRVVAAPEVMSPVRDAVFIVGNYTQREIEDMVNVLRPKPPEQPVALSSAVSDKPGAGESKDRTESAVDVLANLRQLALGVVLFADDHEGDLPATLAGIKPYVPDRAQFAWMCANVTYVGKGNLKREAKPYAVPIAYRKAPKSVGGAYVAFMDGHAILVSSERCAELSIGTSDEGTGELHPDPVGTIRKMLGQWVANARAGDREALRSAYPPDYPRSADDADDFQELLSLNPGWEFSLLSVAWNDEAAMAVSGKLGAGDPKNEPEPVVLVWNLEKLEDRWVITDIDLEEIAGLQRENAYFLQEHPGARVRYLASGPPAAPRDAAGPLGTYALSFDGVDDCLVVPASASLTLKPPFFVEMWARPDSSVLSDWEARRRADPRKDPWYAMDLIRQGAALKSAGPADADSKANTETAEGWPALSALSRSPIQIDQSGGFVALLRGGVFAVDEKSRAAQTGIVRTNQLEVDRPGWTHFYFESPRGDKHTRERYVPAEGPLVIGRVLRNGLPFKGQIAELRIWNKELGMGDTRYLGSTSVTGNEANLVACWTFEEGAGQVVRDVSPNGNHARLGNSTDADKADPVWVDLSDEGEVIAATSEPVHASGEAGDTRLAWRRTDGYVAPDPEGFFPDDAEAGKRLDALFKAVDKDRRSDEEVLSTVRRGFRRTTEYRTNILRWIGNRYVWGEDPQNAEAIEIMYHAIPMERHYAIYFGLSVVKDKTPNILRTLAEICMRREDVGRITWGVGAQRDELVAYIKPYLDDPDPQKRETASVLVQHFEGKLDFDRDKEEKRLERAKAEFADRLPQFKQTLLTGDSRARRDVLTTIQREGLAALLDDSFVPAFQACATDPDRKVRNEVAQMAGGRWVWGAQQQDPDVIALMLELASDKVRDVRYNAVYYGLSVVRDKTEPVIRRLVELALADHENNLYGRIVWGLKGPMRASPEPFEKVLAEYLEPSESNDHLAASVYLLYHDVLQKEPPAEWNLARIKQQYPEDLFTITFSEKEPFAPASADALWNEFAKTLAEKAAVKRMPSFRRGKPFVCVAQVRSQQQADVVRQSIEDNPRLSFGQVQPVPLWVQLYEEEKRGVSSFPYPDEAIAAVIAPSAAAPGPIQQRIDAAAPGYTIRLWPGLYQESLTINKPLTLEGVGWDKTVIVKEKPVVQSFEDIQRMMLQRLATAESDAQREEMAAQMQKELAEKLSPTALRVEGAQNVVIRGIKFTSPGGHVEGTSMNLPIIALDRSGVQVEDCAVIAGPGSGIHILNGSDAKIRRTLVAAVWGTGIAVGDKAGAPSRLRLEDCDIRNCHYAGVRIGPGNDDVRIERCRISGAAWHGVRYDNASPRIAASIIFGNARSGIYASGDTAAVIRSNLFYANEMCGVSCWFQNRDEIEGNTFVENQRSGLEILGASNPTVRRNIFCANPAAVSLGNIGSESRFAQSDGSAALDSNLFWANENDVAWRRDAETTETITPGAETHTLRIDPQFAAAPTKDFSLAAGSPARQKNIGVAEPIPLTGPWPLQPEERAIIPEGDTRDSRQWRHAN